MKHKIIIAAKLFIIFLWFSGCKKEKKLNQPASKIEGINSEWILTKVEQIDVNNTLAFVESDTLLEVSRAFIGGNPMQLNIDANTFTYTIATGSSMNVFNSTSGTWKFDNNEYPAYVVFDEGSVNEARYKLTRPIRPQDYYLVLKVNKVCAGKRTVSYHLWFVRK